MPDPKDKEFVVSLTADFFDSAGQPKYRDLGLSLLDGHPRISRRLFGEHRPIIGSDQIGGANGVIVMTPTVSAESVSRSENLLAIGRFGVGYDNVDVSACTAADVLVFITAGAVDYSVAEATVGWLLALTHHVRTKDILVRTGRWHDRSHFMGTELRDRTLGIVGLGGIGRAVLRLVAPFGMKPPLVFDPYLKPEAAVAAGVRLVDLETLLRESDFVSIHCPLNDQTRGLIGAEQLSWMKPTSYLINTARGGIVNEDALFSTLREKRIAGAALDCFANEPIVEPHRFGQLENVLLAPHAIAWTDELFRDIGRSACQGMVDLTLGQCPKGIVNREVLERPGFKAKWARMTRNSGNDRTTLSS